MCSELAGRVGELKAPLRACYSYVAICVYLKEWSVVSGCHHGTVSVRQEVPVAPYTPRGNSKIQE